MTLTEARPSDDRAVVRRTQQFDLIRSVPAGIIAPLESSVLLTIVITTFDTTGFVKGLVAASSGVGLLASPFLTARARRTTRPAMWIAAIISLVGAAGFLAASLGPLPLLVAGSMVGIAAVSASVPLLTATYERNFATHERGRRVGWGMAVRVGVSALVGLAMGEYLEHRPGSWWHLVLVGALAMVGLAYSQSRIPSQPIGPVAGREHSSLPHFHLLGEDRQLRLTLIAWMFMGFGNLMLLPLRVEYLAGERYGIEATAAVIVLLTVTVPSVVRLACMPLFGALFDRLSFFSARIMVNLLFALYVGAFFSGSSNVGLFLGAVAYGVATAGGDLMWALWVTKFAPPGRVADYMGLHTFCTGIRAVAAPMVGFFVIEHMSLEHVAWLSASMILVATAVLVPEARLERRAV